MKKRILFFMLALLLFLLPGCSRVPSFKYADGMYRDPRSGVSYRTAPFSYHAATYTEGEEIGRVKDKSGTRYFYAVPGLDGFLTDGDHTLYYADGVKLPTLQEMEIGTVDVCKSDVYVVAYQTYFDAEEIGAIVSAYVNGTPLSYDKLLTPASDRYEVIFTGADTSAYPGICYTLEYLTFDDDVLIYANLTAEGKIPDLYPGIQAEIEDGVAVYHFGNQLLFDRAAKLCYPIHALIEA